MTVVKEVTYEIGQRFKIGNYLAILAQTEDSLCALISLEYGDRYNNPIKVGNPAQITQKELSRMSDTLPILVT